MGRPTWSGQGLVEFALVLPIILMLTMVALDFGRIYLGYINVQNMARVAANFAANNASDLAEGDAPTLTRYQNQIALDAAATNCSLPGGTAPAPEFSDANGDGTTTSIGDNAKVGLTCTFRVVTPIISAIMGSALSVSTSVVFPIKTGMSATGIAGGGGCYAPPNASINAAPGTTGSMPSFDVSFTDASGGCPATLWHWDFGDGQTLDGVQDPPVHPYTAVGTYIVNMRATNPYGFSDAPSVTITVVDVVTPPPLCTVPAFSAPPGVLLGDAQGVWEAAGFSTIVGLHDENPHNATTKIKSQTIVGGSLVGCDSPIDVTSN